MSSRLIHIERGIAHPVDAHTWAREILPRLVDDAREDGAALAALVETALEHGVARSALPALAHLRALASVDVDVDALAAAVGNAIADGRGARADDIAGAPIVAPVWAAALAAVSSIVPSVTGRERALFFALSEATPSKLARGLPLALAERLVGPLAPAVVVPVVRGAAGGLFVASKPWSLPEMIALSPVHERPRFLVGGTVDREAIALEVWDLHAGELVARPRARVEGTDGIADVVTALTGELARACGVERTRARAGERRLFPEVATRAYVDALADVELALLAAHGVVPSAALVNFDVALAELRTLATAGTADHEKALSPALTFIAFVACAAAAGLDVPREVRDEAAALANELATAMPSLLPLAQATRGLAAR